MSLQQGETEMDVENFLVGTAFACAGVLFALLFSVVVGVLASVGGLSPVLSVPVAWFIVLTAGVIAGKGGL
jgi:hypothetical protein